MGLRGPIAMPTSVRILRGNRSRRPVNPNEPQPERKAPRCPDHLDEEVMMRAHAEKRFRDWAEATKLYMQIADRLGLHESARAKFAKKDVTADPIGEAMCG